MRQGLKLASAFCLAMAAAQPEPAAAVDLAASLKARIVFTGLDGTPIANPMAGEPFRISVTLTDALTGAPAQPSGGLIAWFRRASKNNPDCKTAVRMYLATEASLPRNTTRLHGLLFASAAENGDVVFLDPNFRLASADLVTAYSLQSPPSDLIWHATRRQLVASNGTRGTVSVITPFGGISTLASGLDRPAGLVAAEDGGVWVAEEGAGRATKLDQSGGITAALAGTPGKMTMKQGGELIAVLSTGKLSLADSRTGKILREEAVANGSRDIALWSDGESSLLALLSPGGDSVRIAYLDAGATPSETKLATPASRLAMSPDGRFLFAFGATERGVSIVDLAAGQLIQGLAFASGVAEVDFMANTAFLRLADGSAVVRVPMSSLTLGKSANVGRTWLGPAEDLSSDDGADLLVPVEASGSMLAVHAASGAAQMLPAKTGMADALANTGFTLRGGVPHRVVAVDIGFAAGPDGIYRNAAVLPTGGDYELILSTGPTGFSDCVAVHAGGAAPPEPVEVAMVALDQPALQAGKSAAVEFALMDDETLVTLEHPPELMMTSLTSGWRQTIRTTRSSRGFSAAMAPPYPGVYVVVPLGLPPSMTLRAAAQVEVAE